MEEGLELIGKTQQRYFEAELRRLKGKLLFSLSREAEGEASLQDALGVARRQSAKSLELRAAISLAGLQRARGNGDEARELLLPVYNWFTEGLGATDLKEAKELLDQLA